MISGKILIGNDEIASSTVFHAVDAVTGETFGEEFAAAGFNEVDRACSLAQIAAGQFGDTEPDTRAALLCDIASRIEGIAKPLIERAKRETGLSIARLEGELARTSNQLRLFSAVLRRGEWLDATIDRELLQRKPSPRPDLRRTNVPLGPVAVFGASNFPLAFSVAGGDTASALAAGCPVVIKGHPAHPGTGEMVARAVRDAVTACGLPGGVFSFLPGPSHELGAALVADPRIRAVGFTGSRAGGLALAKIAGDRPEPIPIFAEMSSINPVVLLPQALAARAEEIAAGFVASLTLGAGQFCTNPGLVIGLEGPDLNRFAAVAVSLLEQTAPTTMLTSGIRENFERGVASLRGLPAVETLTASHPLRSTGGGVALFAVSARDFLHNDTLATEVFGSVAVLVRCRNEDELAEVLSGLEGQLTATLMLDSRDTASAARLLPLAAARAGRIIVNGWPTGVEVSDAMVHGGPYPATFDARSTSVGTLAIMRFVRPLCFQDVPDELLPPALRDSNPWRIQRRVDGELVPSD